MKKENAFSLSEIFENIRVISNFAQIPNTLRKQKF